MTIPPSNPGESPEMTQREEFLIAVEEFEDAVVAERDCAGGVPSFLTEKTAAARSRLLEIWDEQQAEVERREEALEMFRDEQKRDRAEVERLRDSVLTAAQAADLLSVLGRHPEEYPWVAPGTYQKLHANWLRAQRDTAESRVPPKGENTDV